MLHGGEWLAKKYASYTKGSTQSLDTTLATLSSRLVSASASANGAAPDADADDLPPLPDRRAAVLALKGLARDHARLVGQRTLPAILVTLRRDAAHDDDMARALVECLLALTEAVPPPGAPAVDPRLRKLPPHAIAHTDSILEDASNLHALLPLLHPSRSFYTRFSTLQLLAHLLRTHPIAFQSHLLTSPGGCGAILNCLSEGSGSSAEIIRNEALLLLPALVEGNTDIQKLLAFEGAFEKLLDVCAIEGRIEGGVIVQDALEALESLLRWNVSNQNYFRETLSIPLLAPLLFYPPPPLTAGPAAASAAAAQQGTPSFPSRQAEQEHARQLEAFAFQSWDDDEDGDEDAADDLDGAAGAAPAASKAGGVVAGGSTGGTGGGVGRLEFGKESQKVRNAKLVIRIGGLLVEGQGDGRRGNQNALLNAGFTKCLFELALASTAPISLKAQALDVLASLLRSNRNNQDLLSGLLVCPLMATVVPGSGVGAAEAGAAGVPGAVPGAAPDQPAEAAAAAGFPPVARPQLSWARLSARPAVLALIDTAVHGAAPSALLGVAPSAALALRASAITLFGAFVADNLDARLGIISTMVPPPSLPGDEDGGGGTGGDHGASMSAGSLLLQGVSELPKTTAGPAKTDAYKYLLACTLFAHLVRGSETAKALALEIRFGADGKPLPKGARGGGGGGGGADDDDDDEPTSLIQVLIGNLTMAQRELGEATRRERSASAMGGAGAARHAQQQQQHDDHQQPAPPPPRHELSTTDWTRIIVGYLTLLATWLWESKASVRELLSESSNLQTLVQPVAQTGGGVDPLVGGLCALVLGVAYEFGPEPTERQRQRLQQKPRSNAAAAAAGGDDDEEGVVTRATMYPILTTRIGADQFSARLNRLKDDARLKCVGPDVLQTIADAAAAAARAARANALGGHHHHHLHPATLPAAAAGGDAELGLWFEWPFVEWFKANQVLIEKTITVDPTSSSADAAAATAELLDAQRQAEQLRDSLARANREIETLERRLEQVMRAAEDERMSLTTKLAEAHESLGSARASSSEREGEGASLRAQLDAARAQQLASAEATAKARKEAEARTEAAAAQLRSAEEKAARLEAEVEALKGEVAAAAAAAAKKTTEKPGGAGEAEGHGDGARGADADGDDAQGDGGGGGGKTKAELQREIDDLLILLDEMETKHKANKALLRSKGVEVSDDDDDDDDDEEGGADGDDVD